MQVRLDFDSGMFNVVYADPPWSYGDKGFGARNGGAESGAFAPEAGRYPTMPLQDIAALGSEIKRVSSKDSVCLMWATSPLLPEALEVMTAWGFKFKTVAFCWVKQTTTGKLATNLGQWTLGGMELVLLGTRGSPKRLRRDVRQIVMAERGRHSAKPAAIAEAIETMFDGPGLEMFCRTPRDGWQVWGNEV